MKNFGILNSPPVYLEISQSFLKALKDGKYLELPLERGADGRLTTAGREKISSGLRALVNGKSSLGRARAFCAIHAVGVSLRRLTLPASSKDEFENVLRLQIEAEFPLSPDELAWGYRLLDTPGSTAGKAVLVAAVKKETVDEYRELLTECGLDPVFTLASLARNYLCSNVEGNYALVDMSDQRPEWMLFERGIPTSVRMLAPTAEVAVSDSVAKTAGPNGSGGKIYLTGANAEQVTNFNGRIGGMTVAPLTVEAGSSAALQGLKKAVEQNGGTQLLALQNQVKLPVGRFKGGVSSEVRPWLMATVGLICLLLILPYAEAVIMKPFLARKLAALNAEKGRLVTIDHELDFLRSLKQNQPPYLDALYVLAKSAPPGTRFDSLTLGRRGDIAIHGVMQNGMQVTDFRSKLIASGFFSAVSVEEQTPTPDRQRVNLRMTAQWKPSAERVGLAIGPSASEIQQMKTNRSGMGGGGFPPGMMMPQ